MNHDIYIYILCIYIYYVYIYILKIIDVFSVIIDDPAASNMAIKTSNVKFQMEVNSHVPKKNNLYMTYIHFAVKKHLIFHSKHAER